MINKQTFQKQLEINPDTDKFFGLIESDLYIENYNLIEIKESYFNLLDCIGERGIFPIVETIIKKINK